jgi:hypothetical protein
MHDPLLKLLRELQSEFGDRTIAVLLPEVVKVSWYQSLLHTYRARRLHGKLLQYGGPSLAVISMPWYMEKPAIDRTATSEPLHVEVA